MITARQRAPILLLIGLLLASVGSPVWGQGDVDRGAAAREALAALDGMAAWQSYELEESRFLQYAWLFEDAAGNLAVDAYEVEIQIRAQVDLRGDSPAVRYGVNRILTRNTIETTTSLELRVVADTLYINDGSGWQTVTVDDLQAEFAQLQPVLAVAAGTQNLLGGIGTEMFMVLTDPDTILSRTDEIRVNEGRFVGGGAARFYRFIGDGLGDAVAATVLLTPATDDARTTLAESIRDVSVALAVDSEGQVRSRFASYNINLRDVASADFGAERQRFTLQASANLVEHYVNINQDLSITAPPVDDQP